MAKSLPAKLKLYHEEAPAAAARPREAVGSLPEVLRAFRQSTGWPLYYVGGETNPATDPSWSAPVSPGVGTALGHLRLGSPDSSSPPARPPVERESARALASALAGMLGELFQTRQALWEREAELAAGVPLVPHVAGQTHLAARLEAVLKGGAEAIGCQAAALYLLDDATSQLKVRSCWGLPLDRLTAPARPLPGAVADLEALLGHAVVLEDADTLAHWNLPEDFPAAVCVPVSTPTMILGTLWVFAQKKRAFNDRQTNILEVVAGRLAADLEREILLQEGVRGAEVNKQVAAAQRLQRNQLPTISPLLEDWQLSGWTEQAGPLGGDFHDWFCLPDGLLAVAAGHAMDGGIEAAVAAAALKAALRAHGPYYREAKETIKRVNLTLWTGSAGDQHASLFYGLVETGTGRLCYAVAGQPGVVLLRQGGWESLSHTSPRLGESPESDYQEVSHRLQPGEAMVIFTDGIREAADGQGRLLGEAEVAECLAEHLDRSADELAGLLRRRLETLLPRPQRRDRSVLVVKRK